MTHAKTSEPSKEKHDNVRREISAGFIVYRRTSVGVKFLVLYHGNRYWNFPKGKIESEEGNLEAAFRETAEETGLAKKDMRLMNGFKAYERFTFKKEGRKIFKIVIFYLAETKSKDVKISNEHQGYGWFLYPDATRMLAPYRDSQKILKQAFNFLRHPTGSRSPSHPPAYRNHLRPYRSHGHRSAPHTRPMP